MTIGEMIGRWAVRSQELARFKATVDGSTLCEQVIADLEAISAGDDEELLTLKSSAEESGFSTRQLARMIRDGKLVDYGRKNSPRLRRSELPRKPIVRAQAGPDVAPGATMLQIARHSVASHSRLRGSR